MTDKEKLKLINELIEKAFEVGTGSDKYQAAYYEATLSAIQVVAGSEQEEDYG